MSTIAYPSLTWVSLVLENLVIAGTYLQIIFSSCFHHSILPPLHVNEPIETVILECVKSRKFGSSTLFGLCYSFFLLFLWILDTETTEVHLGVPNPMSSPYNTGISLLLDWPSLSYLRLVTDMAYKITTGERFSTLYVNYLFEISSSVTFKKRLEVVPEKGLETETQL